MPVEKEYRVGRSAMPIRPDRDYSGADFRREYADDGALERSLFNGADITDCQFQGISLQNCEFTEALIRNTTFHDCDISGSDFVLAKIERSVFHGCRFESGEWRDSTFIACTFVDCDFEHGTTTLCYFDGCAFDASTAASFDHRAVYHNVYTGCAFGNAEMTMVVSTKNFGLPAAAEYVRDLVHVGAAISLDALCLVNNLGRYRNIFLADFAAALVHSAPSDQKIRAGTIAFLARIVRALAREERISTTSLLFVESRLAALANTISDAVLFVAVMSAVIEVRTAILSSANQATALDADEGEIERIIFRFEGDYNNQHAAALRDTLDQAIDIPGALQIVEIRRGSTIIEMAAVAAVGLSTALTSLNFVLRQAAVTIERIGAIKRAVRKLNPPQRVRKATGRQVVPMKSASVLDVALMPPEVSQLREAVTRHGRLIVELDEAASIRILVQ